MTTEIDSTTVQVCVTVARQVQRARLLAGDECGSDAARQIAQFLLELIEGDANQHQGRKIRNP